LRLRRLARLIGKTKDRWAIQYGEHLKGNGASVFAYVCRLGLDGIVSKRVDASYRSGPSKVWLTSKKSGERGGAPGARGERHQVHLITLAVLELSLYVSFGSPFRMRLGGV